MICFALPCISVKNDMTHVALRGRGTSNIYNCFPAAGMFLKIERSLLWQCRRSSAETICLQNGSSVFGNTHANGDQVTLLSLSFRVCAFFREILQKIWADWSFGSYIKPPERLECNQVLKNVCFKVARPSSNHLPRNWLIFSVSVLILSLSLVSVASWLFQIWEKNWGHHISFFTETELENWSIFSGFCMCFNCKSKGSLHQTVAAKKLYLEFFSKTARTFLIHFSWKWERKKWGSPCSSLLNKQNCLLSSLTQLPNVPNKAITNNPVQFKTVASNGLDMAQSVEFWTLDQLDRDSLPATGDHVQRRHNWVELPLGFRLNVLRDLQAAFFSSTLHIVSIRAKNDIFFGSGRDMVSGWTLFDHAFFGIRGRTDTLASFLWSPVRVSNE